MKNYTIELKWGIIFVLSSLLWMLLERVTGLHDEYIEKHVIYTNLFAFIAIAIYVFALRDKRKNFYNGKMNWMQGFITGVIIAVIVAIFSPLIAWITHNLISPQYFENIIEYSVSEGFMTREDAKSQFNQTSYMIQGSIGAIVLGTVTSAIVALFMKKS